MTYDRTVKAALAETKSKFALAEALALDIPPRPYDGGSSQHDKTVSQHLDDARQSIVAAGGEPRSVRTLEVYRATALWVSKITSGAGSRGTSDLEFVWIPGVSFSTHTAARMAGMSYEDFAANPVKENELRGRTYTSPSQPEKAVEHWTPEQKVSVARDLLNDDQVAAAVVSDPRTSGKVMDAIDKRYEQSAKPTKSREAEPAAKQLQLVWEFRKLHVGMRDILDLASDPAAVVTEAQREAVLAEIKWLRNALDLVEVGLTSEPLHEAVAEFLANQGS